MSMSAGYNIPVSTSVALDSSANPFSDLEDNFFFGNNDTSADSPSQTPSSSATASTAASEQGNAQSSASSATGAAPGAASSSGSGPSLTTYLLIAAVALAIWHLVLKKPL
jgi:hypothetical protein